jgi:adenylyltransferase/sulfurtransferase
MKEVTVQELKAMQDSGEHFTLIDVREPHEFEQANLDGILIPMNDAPDRVSEFPKEGKVVVHCRSGMRSGNVISYLEQTHGYNNLYNLKGGIMAWIAEIDPTVGN